MLNELNIPGARAESGTELLLSEVIAALSHALGLSGGELERHTPPDDPQGMRIGQALRLPVGMAASIEPAQRELSNDGATLDWIAHGFALVIDAKSPWMYRHSEGVATIAAGIAATMQMSPTEIRDIRRAGLLHDVGKLGVSNKILDKPGKLTPEEIAEMRKHTAYTYAILQQVAGFRHLATVAASHHERLDGRGYHRGLGARQLSTAARILAVADMYEALSAKRPYREDLSQEQVMDILGKNVGPGICPVVFAALKRYLANGGYVPVAIAA
jgi:HD-GYP domain-containing protein (c-di-GMP phosphodiesterase class II)